MTTTPLAEDTKRQHLLHEPLVLLLVGVGALVLLLAAAEEPYHIDELRQTRYYAASVPEIVRQSFAQEQPPLDPLLNAALQRVVGVGDVRQRLLSVGFGVGSLLTAASLSLRSGFNTRGSVVVVAVMAFTPLLIGVTAYARPYALPLFLMLVFLWSADSWIERGAKRYALVMMVVAFALPLARTIEPTILLVLTALIFGQKAIAGRGEARGPRLRVAAITSVSGVALAAVPLLLRLRQEVADRTASQGHSVSERLARLTRDLPLAVGEALPYWPLAVVVLVLIGVHPRSREILRRSWWFRVLALTAAGFVALFFLMTPPSQPFFQRYAFTLVPVLGFAAGSLVGSGADADSPWRRAIALATLSGLVLWGVAGTYLALSRQSNADWESISRVLAEELPPDTAIVYDAVRGLGQYRTPFAGFPRYTGPDRYIPLTLQIIESPKILQPGENTVVVLLTERRFDVDGWFPIAVDRFFTIYVPASPYRGATGAALAAEEFAEALGPELGSALALASASLWVELGDTERAAEMLRELVQHEALRQNVLNLIRGTALEAVLPT